jgi:TonB-linked SusC/RagA family outer membrane protein
MNRKIIYCLFLLWTILSGSVIYAQTVNGTVSDATGPLPQATVSVKGTSINTVTDIDGKYTITNVGQNAVLVFSYMGFQSQEVATNGQTDVSVVLKEDSQQLGEVVITGYVGQSKRSITGAVSQVNMNNLERTRIPDVAQVLQGQVAGVFVAANTGAPGDGSVIRIRGEGTIGDNRVLYVVDGTPTRDITFLNQGDVESMTVLKDASATAIYGSRAAGGVIIITTKKGVEGKSSFDVDFFTGIHYVQNLPDMLNAEQYMNVMEQSQANTSPNATNLYTNDRSTLKLADTDWLDELFTQGISRNVQISASGANDKTSYLISGGYYHMDGVVTENNDQYRRVNFRANVNSKLSDLFTVGTNMQLSFQSQDKLSSSGDEPGVIRHALIRPPVLGVYKDPTDPTYSVRNPYTDLPFYTGPVRDVGYLTRYERSSNPLAIVHFTDDVRETFQAFGNVFAEGAFLDKSLRLRTNLGMDVRFFHNKAFYENYGDDDIDNVDDPLFGLGLGRVNRPNSLSESRAQDVTFTWSNTINYVKTFSKHSLNLLLGHEIITNRYSQIVGARSGFDNDSDDFRYLGFGGSFTDSRQYKAPSNGSDDRRWSLLSFFGSGTYGYDNKYYATATIRADASSRFGPGNKWGYFPSLGANWIISNEEFMKNVSWLSSLKVRGSWGQSGNQEIPDGAYLTFVDTSNPLGPQITRFGTDGKWETTTQTNVGLDFGFLNNKLNISADYFHKNTEDIILSVLPPGTTAGSTIQPSFVNSGSIENKGFEFAVNYQNNDNEFKYGVNANLATLDNNVTKLYPNANVLQGNGDRTRTVVGQPLDAYYGYQFEGIYQNQAEIDAQLYTDDRGTVPGDMKFKDVNGDGEIDADDRTFIGSSVPKVTYGLSFNASYKSFDISFLFQGVEDVDRYNDQKQILDYDGRTFNSTTAILGSWTGEGTSNTMPRLTFADTGGSRFSSAFVEDASYLRLKNIEIGYTFNNTLPGIQYLRIYASGQNLLTWTDYTGLDPESTDLVDRGTYPQTAAIMFGAKIKL